ncbi:MAG: hypothetical protein LC105_06255 [Chitinophagales bacterium]|nr:hypothetical protein [Chitinophagales bacterium]
MTWMRNALNKLIARITKEELQMLWDIKVEVLDKRTKQPIGGEGYTIEFYDEDENDVDFLGEGVLNEAGIADVRFNPQAMNAGEEDSIISETQPDIFFIIKKDGVEVYKSATTHNLNYERDASFYVKEGKEIFLGTFLVTLN